MRRGTLSLAIPSWYPGTGYIVLLVGIPGRQRHLEGI